MSGTRSPFPRGRAISPSAILVSHGQPSDPEVAEAELAELRDAVGALLDGWHVGSATLAAPGSLGRALAGAGTDPLIYPHFMTDNWFTGTVLPKRLGGAPARILPPFGVDPAQPALTSAWLRRVLADLRWRASDTRLIVAGHGSGRGGRSARDTARFANAVRARLGLGDLRLGYVEQAPFLVDALRGAGDRAICLPFFAARRGHVLEDLPEAIAAADFGGVRLDPLGLHPDVPLLIADALARARDNRISAA